MQGSATYKATADLPEKNRPPEFDRSLAGEFQPPGVMQTIHDIIRFAHEMAMQEMFQIGEGLDQGSKCGRSIAGQATAQYY